MSSKTVLAVDLGASSGRVVTAQINKEKINFSNMYRFKNEPIYLKTNNKTSMHWDIAKLYKQTVSSINKAVHKDSNILSIGVDSWAVDYGRINSGKLVDSPYHYRDNRCENGVAIAGKIISEADLYKHNGLQQMSFNTIYQLLADKETGLLEEIDKVLLIPDLFNYLFSGEMLSEETNVSTTGLFNAKNRKWDEKIITTLGLNKNLFTSIIKSGEIIGTTNPSVLSRNAEIKIASVASHDTASAIAAIPYTGDDFAYISSGTWSLVGVEIDSPILIENARKLNFTNEAGINGTIRLLKNVMGMWLINECFRIWKNYGQKYEINRLLAEAAQIKNIGTFDVTRKELMAPKNMLQTISKLCALNNQKPPETPAEYIRSICESLALEYKKIIIQLREITSKQINRIHIVGGGSQNKLLCQLSANICQIPVYAGPVEATALGNVLLQAKANSLIGGSLEEIRIMASRSSEVKKYLPQNNI